MVANLLLKRYCLKILAPLIFTGVLIGLCKNANSQPQTAFYKMDSTQLTTAIKELTALHIKKPLNAIVINQLAQAYSAAANIDSSLIYWKLYCALKPTNDTAFYTIATIYNAINNADSILAYSNKAFAIKPDCIPYLELKALASYKLHLYDSALVTYDRIIALSPTNLNALLLSGIILQNQAKHIEAIKRFNQCLITQPANTDALIYRADEFVLQKKYNDALRDYAAARADLTTNADVLNNIGICYYQSGEYKKAIIFFEKAIAINKQHPQSYFNKGISYYHLNSIDTASTNIKTAGHIWHTSHADTSGVNYLDAIYYLGICYKKTGNLTAASNCFELLQKQKYKVDTAPELKLISYARYISRNWYYFVLLFLLLTGLLIAIVRLIKGK